MPVHMFTRLLHRSIDLFAFARSNQLDILLSIIQINVGLLEKIAV